MKITLLFTSLLLMSSCTTKWSSETEVECPCKVSGIEKKYSLPINKTYYVIKMRSNYGDYFTFITDSPDYKIGETLK